MSCVCHLLQYFTFCCSVTSDYALLSTVTKHADVDALIVKHQNIRWTYSELAEKVNIVAQNLLNYGIRPGDRVGTSLTK